MVLDYSFIVLKLQSLITEEQAPARRSVKKSQSRFPSGQENQTYSIMSVSDIVGADLDELETLPRDLWDLAGAIERFDVETSFLNANSVWNGGFHAGARATRDSAERELVLALWYTHAMVQKTSHSLYFKERSSGCQVAVRRFALPPRLIRYVKQPRRKEPVYHAGIYAQRNNDKLVAKKQTCVYRTRTEKRRDRLRKNIAKAREKRLDQRYHVDYISMQDLEEVIGVPTLAAAESSITGESRLKPFFVPKTMSTRAKVMADGATMMSFFCSRHVVEAVPIMKKQDFVHVSVCLRSLWLDPTPSGFVVITTSLLSYFGFSMEEPPVRLALDYFQQAVDDELARAAERRKAREAQAENGEQTVLASDEYSAFQSYNTSEESDTTLRLENASAMVSSFINSPLGMRCMNFLGRLIGVGLLRREWVELSLGGVALWNIPEVKDEQCTYLSIIDIFCKLLVKVRKAITQCLAEKSILPLAYDDQDVRVLESNMRKIDVWAPQVSTGNLKGLSGLTDEEYGETLRMTTDLVRKVIAKGLKGILKAQVESIHRRLQGYADEFALYQANKAGKISPLCIMFYGGTGCGKTSMSRTVTHSLVQSSGFLKEGEKPVIGTVEEFDAFDTSAKSNTHAFLLEDANNATAMSRGQSASNLVLRLTGPDARPAVKATAEDKGKVYFNHKIFTMTTNTPELGAKEDSNCPESILRRIHLRVGVEPLPWLTLARGSTLLDSRLVTEYIQMVGMEKTAAPEIQTFTVEKTYTRPGSVQGRQYVAFEPYSVDDGLTPRTAAMFDAVMRRLVDRSAQVAESPYFKYSYVEHNALMAKVVATLKDRVMRHVPYALLMAFSVEYMQAHFKRETTQLDRKQVHQEAANLCPLCFYSNYECECGDKKVSVDLQAKESKVKKPDLKRLKEKSMLERKHEIQNELIQDVEKLHVKLANEKEKVELYKKMADEATKMYNETFYLSRMRIWGKRLAAFQELVIGALLPDKNFLARPTAFLDVSISQFLRVLIRSYNGSVVAATELLAMRECVKHTLELLCFWRIAVVILISLIMLVPMGWGITALCLPMFVASYVLFTWNYFKERTLEAVENNKGRLIIPEPEAGELVNMTKVIRNVSVLSGLVGIFYVVYRMTRTAERGEVQSAYNMQQKIPLQVTERTATMTTAQVKGKLRKNLGRIYMILENGRIRETNTLCIGENVYLFPYHLFTKDVRSYKIQMNDSEPTVVTPITSAQLYHVPGKDLMAIRSANGGSRADIAHLFPRKLTHDSHQRLGTLVMPYWLENREVQHVSFETGKEMKHNFDYPEKNPHKRKRKDYVTATISTTQNGDCCSVLVVNERAERCVAGLLFGAVKSKRSLAYFEPLTEGEVRDIIEKTPNDCKIRVESFDEEMLLSQEGVSDAEPHWKSAVNHITPGGNHQVVGSYQMKTTPRAQIGDTLVTHRVKEMFPEARGLEFCAPPFHVKEDGTPNWPFTTALDDIVHAEATYHVMHLDEITREYLQRVTCLVELEKRGPCTNAEVLHGIPGQSLSPMKMTTSAGFPHMCVKATFATLEGNTYVLHPSVWQDFAKADEKLRCGTRVQTIYRATLKNEPVMAGQNKKARVFCAGPMIGTMLVRKYFGPMINFFHRNQVATECACGVDPVSADWETLFEPHMIRSHAIAFDYKKFDRQVTAEMKSTVAYVMIRILEAFGYSTIDLLAARTLLAEYVEVTVAFHGAIIRCFSMMPSGFPLTTIGNSIDNSLRVRSAFKVLYPEESFADKCSLTTYGDDAVLTTDVEDLTLRKLAEGMLALNVVITDANKSGELSDHKSKWEEATFLSRQHVYHPKLGYYVGALQNSSLYKGLLARDISRKATTPESHFLSSVRSFIYELFAHGEERYNREMVLVRRLITGEGFTSDNIQEMDWSYDDHVERVQRHKHTLITAPSQGRVVESDPSTKEHDGVLLKAEYVERIVDGRAIWVGIHQQGLPPRLSTVPDRLSLLSGNGNNGLATHFNQQAHSGEDAQTITKFEDSNAGWQVGEYHDDPSRGGSDAKDLSMEQFFERPIRILITQWTSTSPPFLFNPWVRMLEQPKIRNKLETYANFRANLELRFAINGTRFHSGHMLAAYKPLANTSNIDLQNATVLTAAQAIQCQHISLSPTEQRGGVLNLPFIHHNDMLDISNNADSDDIRNMGNVLMVPLVALGEIAPTATPAVEITVYGRFTNVVMSGVTNAGVATLQSEIVDTPISSRLGAFANFSKLFQSVPVIGKYAQATSLIASTGAHIAAHYGYSQPPRMPQADKYYKGYGDNFSTAHQESHAASLTYDPKSEVTIDPTTIGLPGLDEMAFQNIIRKPGLVTVMQWPDSVSTQDTLGDFPVSPLLSILPGTNGERVMTPLEHVATPFTYWRGTMCFRFQVIATGLHTGRLRVSYDAEVVGPDGPRNASRNLIVDIGEKRDFTVEIPWSNHQMYKRVGASTITGETIRLLPGGVELEPFCNGIMHVTSETPAKGPPDSPPVRVIVTAFSNMMEFFEPQMLNIPPFMVRGGYQMQRVNANFFPVAWGNDWDRDFNPMLGDANFVASNGNDGGTTVTYATKTAVAGQDPIPVTGAWWRQGSNGYTNIRFYTDGRDAWFIVRAFTDAAGNGTFEIDFERDSVFPANVEVLNQDKSQVLDTMAFPNDGDTHTFDASISGGTPNSIVSTQYWLRPAAAQNSSELIIRSARFTEPSDAEHGMINYTDAQFDGQNGTVGNNRIDFTGDFTITLDDVADNYPLYADVCLFGYPADVNGVTMPARDNKTFHYTQLVGRTDGPYTFSPNGFRSLFYPKRKGVLQAEEVENEVEHAPTEDAHMVKMADTVRTPGIEKICYDDSIVSFRTMLKRQSISGIIPLAVGVNHVVRPGLVPWFPGRMSTACKTLMGYVAMPYLAYRGSVRKKLVPLGPGVNMYTLGRPSGYNGAIAGDTFSSRFGLLPTIEGCEAVPGSEVGHITIPYHQPYRYLPYTGLSELRPESLGDNLGYRLSANCSRETAYAEYTSTGEDFNFFGHWNLPVIESV